MSTEPTQEQLDRTLAAPQRVRVTWEVHTITSHTAYVELPPGCTEDQARDLVDLKVARISASSMDADEYDIERVRGSAFVVAPAATVPRPEITTTHGVLVGGGYGFWRPTRTYPAALDWSPQSGVTVEALQRVLDGYLPAGRDAVGVAAWIDERAAGLLDGLRLGMSGAALLGWSGDELHAVVMVMRERSNRIPCLLVESAAGAVWHAPPDVLQRVKSWRAHAHLVEL